MKSIKLLTANSFDIRYDFPHLWKANKIFSSTLFNKTKIIRIGKENKGLLSFDRVSSDFWLKDRNMNVKPISLIYPIKALHA